jgi:pimeloyl-ACP methyl ester carboxylesterase
MKHLHFTQQGFGKKIIVLIHGFCEDNSIWQQFMPSLAQKYKVIAPDLGGFGNSKNLLPHDVTIEDLAEQVKKLLDELEVKECIMVGHSLGGYVSLAYAEKYANTLKGLSLFHSSALADSETKKRARNQTTFFVQKNGVPAFAEDFSAMMFFQPRQKELNKEVNFIKDLVKKTPEKTILEVTIALRDRPDRTELLKTCNFPVQFIIGREDVSIPFSHYAEQVFYPKDADIQILNDTAHVGMLERPQETLQMIHNFVQRCWKEYN